MLNMDNFLKEVDYALEVLDNHSNSSSKDEKLSDDEKKAVSKSNESQSYGRGLCSSIV